MNRHGAAWLLTGLGVVGGAVACPSAPRDDGGVTPGTTANTGGPHGAAASTSATTTAATTGATSTGTTAGVDPDAGVGPGPGSTPPDGVTGQGADGCDYGTLGSTRGDYEFNPGNVCDTQQIDRVGVPAVGGLLITSIDAYNAATPADDQFLGFAVEINGALSALHSLLDDDIEALGLMPCGFVACNAVVTPLVIPDTLRLDLDAPPGFPNGRHPADPVFDRMLAALLLDAAAHPVTTLSAIPLSPADNDLPLGDAFPFLAPPHP